MTGDLSIACAVESRACFCNSPNFGYEKYEEFFHFLFPCLHHSTHMHYWPFQTFTWKQLKWEAQTSQHPTNENAKLGNQLNEPPNCSGVSALPCITISHFSVFIK